MRGVVSQTIVGLQRPIVKLYTDHYVASQPLSCVNAFHPFIFLPSGVLCLGVLVSSTSIGESHTREQLTGQAPIDKMQAVGFEPLCT